jgi:AcrR family transcriptional regulator
MPALKSINLSNLFLKDPQGSELGKNIIRHSILKIDHLGFEAFTFKKLAVEIGVTEPSIYRYFENKQKLLHYLISWYWNWLEYRVLQETSPLNNTKDKLLTTIELLCNPIEFDKSFDFVNEAVLYRVVINESSKVYLNKQVDEVHNRGLYLKYENLGKIIAGFITKMNPSYRFAHTLASTLIETAHLQHFFSAHIPGLTDCSAASKDCNIQYFLSEMLFNTIGDNTISKSSAG